MNIPEDLYEAARIDGASPYQMYRKITLPYMMFVMGPSLITTFVGNLNNFNVIYLLTGGTTGYPDAGWLPATPARPTF
jgi:arabinogalactan oligomer/maltooligosaccharide transport system permease protein